MTCSKLVGREEQGRHCSYKNTYNNNNNRNNNNVTRSVSFAVVSGRLPNHPQEPNQTYTALLSSIKFGIGHPEQTL